MLAFLDALYLVGYGCLAARMYTHGCGLAHEPECAEKGYGEFFAVGKDEGHFVLPDFNFLEEGVAVLSVCTFGITQSRVVFISRPLDYPIIRNDPDFRCEAVLTVHADLRIGVFAVDSPVVVAVLLVELDAYDRSCTVLTGNAVCTVMDSDFLAVAEGKGVVVDAILGLGGDIADVTAVLDGVYERRQG